MFHSFVLYCTYFVGINGSLSKYFSKVNFYEFVDYLKQLCMSLVEMVLND